MKKLPEIQIISITDNPDGTASVEYQVGDDFIEWYKKKTGKKRATKKGLDKFVLDMLTKAIEKRDGYDLKPID